MVLTGDWEHPDDDEFADHIRRENDKPDAAATAWITICAVVAFVLIIITLEAIL